MTDAAIDRLLAIEAIKQVKYAYCRCLDQKLWDDQIVVATRYIGPMARRPAGPSSRGTVGP